MSKMKHEHRWGPWLRAVHFRLKRHPKTQRWCTEGWCPLGQYKNGRTFVARPERKA